MRFYSNNCNISVKDLLINKPTRIFNGAYAVAKSLGAILIRQKLLLLPYIQHDTMVRNRTLFTRVEDNIM